MVFVWETQAYFAKRLVTLQIKLVSLSPSTEKRMTEIYARIQPTIIALLILGLDILMHLEK